MTESTPTDPLPGEGPAQAIPPAAGMPQPPPGEAATQGPERTMAMLCHLSALLVVTAIPFANILGPLAIWLWKRDAYPFVADQGKEALNFQISMTIYFIVSAILVLVVVGIFLLIALGIAWLVLVIVATVRANEGKRYRYPLTIRLID